MRRHFHFCSLLLLVACGRESSLAPALLNPPLVLLPLDGGIYLAWEPPSAGLTYQIDARTDDGGLVGTWLIPGGPAHEAHGLLNGAQYHFTVRALAADGRTVGVATASGRPDPAPARACAPLSGQVIQDGVVVFCDQSALERWLSERGGTVGALRCRGKAVQGAVLPDCIYRYGELLLFLDRALGGQFTGATFPGPAEVRRRARSLLYGSFNPWGPAARFRATWRTTDVMEAAIAYEVRIAGTPFVSRLTWFTPTGTSRGTVIYHEGHGSSALVAAGPMIDSLLASGWAVVAMDMPLEGRNQGDRIGLAVDSVGSLHNLLGLRKAESLHPIGMLLLPIKAVVDEILRRSPGHPIVLAGRSGGGWSTYVYGALDERISAVIAVAGGLPASRRLDAGFVSIGDYEQMAPEFYDWVPHEALMAAAGARGALYLWSSRDRCCYPLLPEDPFVGWLRSRGTSGRPIRVTIQESTVHGVDAEGFVAIRSFLQEVFPATD